MAKKYDLRTKQGKDAAKAEADIAMLGDILKTIFFPIKLIFRLIFMLVMKIFNR